MKKQKLKIDRNTAINCKTREEETKVGFILDKLGYTVYNGDCFSECSYFDIYKEETCILPDDESFCCISYAKEHGYPIISAEKFIKLHEEKITMKKQDLKIDRKTVIHCKTRQESDKVSIIIDKLGYKWYSRATYLEYSCWRLYNENTCINPHLGTHNIINYYKTFGYSIISAKDFLKLHEKNATEKKKNTKIYYRGDPERGDEIIKALENLGGINDEYCNGANKNFLYFIGKNNYIYCCLHETNEAWLLEHAFKEAFLPAPKVETIVIDGVTYENTNALKNLISTLKKYDGKSNCKKRSKN